MEIDALDLLLGGAAGLRMRHPDGAEPVGE
jgi:hypothetical protein